MNKDTLQLLLIVLPLFAGAIGYYLRFYLDRKKELLSDVNRERRQHYQNFVNLVLDLFSKENQGEEGIKNVIQGLREFYKKYVLYASPEVILEISDFFQFVYKGTEGKTSEVIKRLTRIMTAMRKDLGLSNKNLGNDGEKLLRALLTDFDIHFNHAAFTTSRR